MPSNTPRPGDTGQAKRKVSVAEPRVQGKATQDPASAHASIGSVRENLLANPHDRAVSPSPLSAAVQRMLVSAFVGILIVVFGLILMNRWRRGVFILGFAMIYLAVVRWLVDSKILGVLAVRSRKFDSAFSASLGATMMLIAFGVESLGS